MAPRDRLVLVAMLVVPLTLTRVTGLVPPSSRWRQRGESAAPTKRKWLRSVGRDPNTWRRLAFLATALNPMFAIVENDYRNVPWPVVLDDFRPRRMYAYIVSLKPRVLFSIGGLLRGLQLTTPIQHVFDPGVGCGAGINLLALFTGTRWPSVVVVGWAATRRFWRLLGAQRPPPIRLPISLDLDDLKYARSVRSDTPKKRPNHAFRTRGGASSSSSSAASSCD